MGYKRLKELEDLDLSDEGGVIWLGRGATTTDSWTAESFLKETKMVRADGYTHNVEALQQLYRVIMDAPEHRLHMNAFAEKAHCGTAYCAAGWARVDKQYFRPLILKAMKAEGYDISDINDFSAVEYALADILGISMQNADTLFAANICHTIDKHTVKKEEVLENIERLMANKDAVAYKPRWERP